MATVSVRNVWKEYGPHVVLENVRLEIADHEFVTIVGASGCGKTTFLQDAARHGAADARRRSSSTASRSGREPDPDRGVVFQRYSSFPHLTVLENVMLGLELRALAACRQAVRRGTARSARGSAGHAGVGGAGRTRAIVIPRSSPAACSSACRSRRR